MMPRAVDEENLKLQIWKFDGNQVVACNDGLVLDIAGGTADHVIMYTSNGGTNQQFIFVDNEIVSVRDGTVLDADVSNGGVVDGSLVCRVAKSVKRYTILKCSFKILHNLFF